MERMSEALNNQAAELKALIAQQAEVIRNQSEQIAHLQTLLAARDTQPRKLPDALTAVSNLEELFERSFMPKLESIVQELNLLKGKVDSMDTVSEETPLSPVLRKRPVRGAPARLLLSKASSPSRGASRA